MHPFVRQFKKALKEIEDKRSRGKFSAALERVEALLEQEALRWSPTLLILRSVLIRQGDGSKQNSTLESAEENLRSAAALDPISPDAKIELGWLLHTCFNKPKAALAHFQEAIRRSSEFLQSAMIGRADCINDLHGPAEALSALEEAEKLFPESVWIHELKTGYIKALEYQSRQQLKRGRAGKTQARLRKA